MLTGLDHIIIGVNDLEPSESFTGEADGWEAMLVSFPLGQSGQHFELAVPLPFGSDLIENELLPDPGSLARHLRHFGESLCRITLAVENLAASRGYLDRQAVTYTYRDTPRPVLWIHSHQSCGAAFVLHEFTPDLPASNPLHL